LIRAKYTWPSVSQAVYAYGGGGISTGPGAFTIFACLITGNSADTAGGGIFVGNGGTLSFDDATSVFGNSAPVDPDIHYS
jgi:hypothetical protein